MERGLFGEKRPTDIEFLRDECDDGTRTRRLYLIALAVGEGSPRLATRRLRTPRARAAVEKIFRSRVAPIVWEFNGNGNFVDTALGER